MFFSAPYTLMDEVRGLLEKSIEFANKNLLMIFVAYAAYLWVF